MLLREHRANPTGVADLLNWAFAVEDGVILQKDGSLLYGWRYRGPDRASASDSEIGALSRSVSDVLAGLGDGWMWHVDAIRRPAVAYAACRFPSPATQLIDDERRAAYAERGARFETERALIVTWAPPVDAHARVGRWFMKGTSRRDQTGVDWGVKIEAFAQSRDQLEAKLGARLVMERLGSDAVCTHLHECLTGEGHRVRTPDGGAYLNIALASRELMGGFEPRVGERHVRVVAIHGYPPASEPDGLAFLGELPFALRWSTRVIPLSGRTAETLIKRTQLRWFQKRRGAGAWVREMTAKQGDAGAAAARERNEELFSDQDAVRMAQDAAAAAAENARGDVRFCFATPCIVLMDADRVAVDRQAQEVVARLGDAGYPARVETVNALEAFLGTLPGHGTPNVRRALVTSRNVADMLPLSTVWPGLATNPSPYFPANSPPLLWAATSGTTPFRVNLHDSDVGHTIIVGKTGAGKSTLVGLIVAQWQRYENAQVFVFDVGYSGWLLCRATGGTHYDIGVADGALGLQPLARIDQADELIWASEWIETVLELQGVRVTPNVRQAVDRGLALVAKNPVEHRTLSELVVQCQESAVALALRPYTVAGPYGVFLDGNTDAADGGAHQVFELKSLFDMDDRILVPVLLCVFRRVERRLDGRPTLIVIEELWGPLMRSTFAARIRQWLLTLRKQNAAVVLVAHSPAQLEDVPNAQVIWEACPTRIYLPNADATAPNAAAVYARMGLSEREIATIARATPKRDYYYTSPKGRRLFELALGPTALRLLATPSEEERRRIMTMGEAVV